MRSIALVFLLFRPSKYAKRDLLINSIISGALMFLIPAAPLISQHSFTLLFIVFLFAGFGRGYNFVASFIFNQYFDAGNKDREIVRLWNSLIDFFPVVTVLFFSLMMYNLHWSWQACIIISNSFFILFQIIFYLYMDEGAGENNDQNSQASSCNSLQIVL